MPRVRQKVVCSKIRIPVAYNWPPFLVNVALTCQISHLQTWFGLKHWNKDIGMWSYTTMLRLWGVRSILKVSLVASKIYWNLFSLLEIGRQFQNALYCPQMKDSCLHPQQPPQYGSNHWCYMRTEWDVTIIKWLTSSSNLSQFSRSFLCQLSASNVWCITTCY